MRLPCEPFHWQARPWASLALRASLGVARLTNYYEWVGRNQHFLGFQRAGRYQLPALLADVRRLPAGVTEVALHPSLADGFPYAQYQGYQELQTILQDEFLSHLQQAGVTLTSWHQCARGTGLYS